MLFYDNSLRGGTWTVPIGAGRQLPPRPQQRGRRDVDLWDLRHLGKVFDLDLWRRLLGLLLVVLLEDLGDGDVGLDLDPLVGAVAGVGNCLVGVVRVRLPLQDDVGRAGKIQFWDQISEVMLLM